MRLTPRTTLTSLIAFRMLDYHNINDADITELDLVAVDLHENQHQLSEELTVSGQRGKLTWLSGVFLFHETDRQPTLVRLGGPRLENLLDPDVSASSEAGFGQATVAIAPRLSVTGGLRYTSERKTIDNAGRLSTINTPVVVVPGSAYAYTDAISHSAWTPKVGLEVNASNHSLIYVSATRGFKSGGFNITSTQPGRGYAPEFAWSYEGGVKTGAADGRAWLSVAAFHTDYTNLQVQTPIRPGVIDISNAAAATINGVEIESAMQPSPAWRAGGHVAWLDAIYDRYIAIGAGGITGDAAGHRLNNAPEWSGRLWLEWNGRIVRAGTLRLRAESSWQSTVFFTPFNDAIQRQRGYGVLDASAELAPRHWWAVSLYGRNLTNQDYITGTFSTPPPAIGGRPGLPRQVGVQFTFQR
jgi:iron complex outermembrane receptor protein